MKHHVALTGVLEAKRGLQFATAGTFRGGLITPTQRAVVEEAIVRLYRTSWLSLLCWAHDHHTNLLLMQIDLEAYGSEIDYQQLEGLWRLIYTTALDVVCIVVSLYCIFLAYAILLCT